MQEHKSAKLPTTLREAFFSKPGNTLQQLLQNYAKNFPTPASS